MVRYVPPPDPRALLPPLLACLPTAFVSPRPPPALLPLLSPILSQRVQLLATSSPSSSDSWLALLCWDANSAEQLVEIVSQSDAFELHPISGEIELGPFEPITYRRLDKETLQARIATPETDLEVILLWCETDGDNEGSAWRIAEVKPLEHPAANDMEDWYSSIVEAEEKADQQAFEEVIHENGNASPRTLATRRTANITDEDDYWAQYDKTPGRTPGAGHSPALPQAQIQSRQAWETSEAEYFARYTNVQPEMDNDDPSQEGPDIGESTLDGNVIASSQPVEPLTPAQPSERSRQQPAVSSLNAESPAMSRLEQAADTQSVAATAVRQHVISSMRSLYRLCKSTGMEASEFEGLMSSEVQALSLLEDV